MKDAYDFSKGKRGRVVAEQHQSWKGQNHHRLDETCRLFGRSPIVWGKSATKP